MLVALEFVVKNQDHLDKISVDLILLHDVKYIATYEKNTLLPLY